MSRIYRAAKPQPMGNRDLTAKGAKRREFTTEAQSSQSSEYFLIKNSFFRALSASAVSCLLDRNDWQIYASCEFFSI